MEEKNKCIICGAEIEDYRFTCDKCYLIKVMEEHERIQNMLKTENDVVIEDEK